MQREQDSVSYMLIIWPAKESFTNNQQTILAAISKNSGWIEWLNLANWEQLGTEIKQRIM